MAHAKKRASARIYSSVSRRKRGADLRIRAGGFARSSRFAFNGQSSITTAHRRSLLMLTSGSSVLIGALMGAVSLLYATAGQAGGTAFLAVMAVASFPADEMRPTSLLLNIVAASYSTWRLHRHGTIDWSILKPVAIASLPTAFIGGLIVLETRVYLATTGCILLLAAVLMVIRRDRHDRPSTVVAFVPTLLTGAGVGLIAGITGVGGGVFLAPILIFTGWLSPKRTAAISSPFILANSIVGFAGALIAGQQVAGDIWIYAVATLCGTVLGTAIHLRWMSHATTRYMLAAILIVAAYRLLYL
jgi:hypothetical protein